MRFLCFFEVNIYLESFILSLSLQTNWYLIVIILIGVILSLVFSIKKIRYATSKPRMVFMEVIRILIVLLISFTLLRPEIVTKIVRKTEPEVVILHDVSDSMQTQDLVTESEGMQVALKRNEWVARQLDKKFYAPLTGKYRVSVESFSMPANQKKEENGTDLAFALSDQIAGFKNLRAVILLSDADWNYGGSPVGAASKLRAQVTPVYAVATGSSVFLPDIELKKVKVPAFCLADEKISIPFQIQSRMNHDVKLKATLSSEYGIENTKEIYLPAREVTQDSIIWQPEKTGDYSLTLEIPVQKDELISGNNRFSFNINVKRDLLKVLVVDSYPRWEYRYLRNALMRDPGVEVKTLLLHPGMEPGKGKNYLSKFPDKEDITQFDVIFLGDVGIATGELTEENMKLIEGVVKYQGTGLVFLPGYRGQHLTFQNSIIKDMYPVELDKNRPEGISSGIPAKMELSSAGRKHFLLMLADSPSANSYVWKGLPGFCWNAAVTKPKPGAQVLAVHSGLQVETGRMPLIVTRDYGNGNVLFMGTDSAWKWRKGVEDKYHYRYWGQVVRWMAHKRHLADNKGFRCFIVPENPQAGRTVFLFAALHDRLGRPLDNAVVDVNVSSNKNDNITKFQLLQDKIGWGVYKGSFVPEAGGTYKVSLDSPQSGSKLALDINVTGEKREYIGRPVKIKTLYEIANITRGEVFMPENLNQIISRIDALPQNVEIEKRLLLWSQWWWGAIILLLLTVYWSLRKIFGLL